MPSASFSYGNCAAPRSLDDDSAATLVHAFVSIRADYCGSLFDRCCEEDDRQATACPQRCGPNRVQHSQVRSRAESVPARRASLAHMITSYISRIVFHSELRHVLHREISHPRSAWYDLPYPTLPIEKSPKTANLINFWTFGIPYPFYHIKIKVKSQLVQNT